MQINLTYGEKCRIIDSAMDIPASAGKTSYAKYATTPFRVEAIRTAGSNADRRHSRLIDRVKSSNFISWLLYNRVQPAQTCETVNKRRSIYHAKKSKAFYTQGMTVQSVQASLPAFLFAENGDTLWRN